MKVNPDLKFVDDLVRSGGADVKKCYQCATCSVVCQLSPKKHPYPRKEMIWAGWGLKDELAGDPDLWLCHQCGDCTVQCPRDAKPGEVMAAARMKAIEHFAFPSFMGKLVREPGMIPVLVLISGVFLAAMVGVQKVLNATTHLMFHEAGFEYEEFLSHPVLIAFFSTAFVLAMLFALLGVKRFWDALEAKAADWGTGEKIGFVPAMIEAVTDLLTHNRFHRCEAGRVRRTGHLFVFYGFLGLLIVTSIATVLTFLEVGFMRELLGIAAETELYPLGWLHPVKIAGNLAGLAMVGGAIYVWNYRSSNPEMTGQTSYTDWFFLGLIFAVGLTGFCTEFVRLIPPIPPVLGTPIYLLHLMSVFWLLIFLPYTKFAHAFYRLFAMAWARSRGRLLPKES